MQVEFVCRWNLVDLVIVILSLAGILIESLSSNKKLLINPNVARSLRVLRIIRGGLINDLFHERALVMR